MSMRLRHVDAMAAPSPLRRAFGWLATTRPLLFFSRNVSWKLDPVLLWLTGFVEYRRRAGGAGRTIPLLRLTPRDVDLVLRAQRPAAAAAGLAFSSVGAQAWLRHPAP